MREEKVKKEEEGDDAGTNGYYDGDEWKKKKKVKVKVSWWCWIIMVETKKESSHDVWMCVPLAKVSSEENPPEYG